ncbi:MAG: TetR/AcrR family transcriptional regulator [Deltaproteobacteria bacterium]|nr:TetR/AcrR family transcriptional regulator [Deltaproteobacteria bacterium]
MVGKRAEPSSQATGSKPVGVLEDARERILKAATRLLAARGFDGTTLQAVADEVGIRKPSVLHHFPSKEDLRQGVLQQMLDHWNGVLPRLLLAASTGEGRFEAIIQEIVRFFVDDPDRARLLLREVLDRPDEMRVLLARHVRPWLQLVAKYIRSGQDHGLHYPSADPEAYVIHVLHLVLVGIALRGTLEALLEPGSHEAAMERQVQELMRIAKCSLFPPQPDGREKGRRAGPSMRKTRR